MSTIKTPYGTLTGDAAKKYMASNPSGSYSVVGGTTPSAPATTGSVTPTPTPSAGTGGSTGGTSTPYSNAAKATNAQPGFTTNGAKVWKVGGDGRAPSGAGVGDYVVTGGGTYKIGEDGKGVLVNAGVTTANYKGGYYTPPVSAGTGSSAGGTKMSVVEEKAAATQPGFASNGAKIWKVGDDGRAPSGADVGDYVVTGGGTYKIGADGKGVLVNKDVTTANYKDGYYTPPTYSDEAQKNNVDPTDALSIVQALAAMWQNPNSDYLAYLKKANNAAVNKAVSSLEAQKKSADQSYADIFRRLYINKMLGQKNMDQQLAAQGITGGMAETTRLGYDTQYADALRQGEIERLNTLAGLDQAITDTRYNGDISYAQAAAQEAQQRQTNYANVLAQLLTRQDNLDAAALSQSNWEKQFAEAIRQANLAQQNTDTARQDNLDATNRSVAANTVSEAIKMGIMPDDATIAAAGMDVSKETLLQMAAEQAKQIAKSDLSQIGAEQAKTMVAAVLNGDRSEEARRIIEYFYQTPMETVLKAYV